MNDRFTEMLGVLAHEMRTPLAAILGYQELLAEGIFGKVDERGQEPLSRIAYSARQLLHLIDGVQEIMSPPEKRLELNEEVFDPIPVLRMCIRNAATDAHGRNVKLAEDISLDLPAISGDPDRFCRAIDLALAAAIKTSHGATIAVSARAHDGVEVLIAGTALRPGRDDPPATHLVDGKEKLTGAGLRLAIVRHLAQQMDGDIRLLSVNGTATLHLHVPASDD
ncbi:MAG TPA: HAMP domain-containing sensor histidine kinase [Longimicrobiales bacterium]|nr:HAMP domain-containing sensor histidine kinase [Longimicrobiales bacterium]